MNDRCHEQIQCYVSGQSSAEEAAVHLTDEPPFS